MSVAQFAIIILTTATALWAQSATASLSGSVLDPRDSAIPGATLVLLDMNTGLSREMTGNDAGQFVFSQLSPGHYRLTVTKETFKTSVVDNLVLAVNDQRALRLKLEVGAKTESVNVSGIAPLVSESPAIATSIDREFFENQPMSGRSFQSLISLAPGTVPTAANLVTPGQFSINGQRGNANYFTVDGVSANFATSASVTPYENGGGVPALSSLGSTNTLASVDAVQEFTIQTSTYAAEYGRQPGGQIAIVTRSGTNEYHGTAFNYLRNVIFDANNFFTNAAGLPRAAIKQNDFGGVFGGPVIRNRTFFFVSYEGLRLRQPFVTIPLQVPTLAARAAASGPVKELLEAFPLPTGPVSATDPMAAAYQASFSNPSTLNATSFRLDHSFNSRFTLFGRYNYAPSENQERAKFCAASCVSVTASRAETLTTGSTMLLTSRLTNDLRFNFSKSKTVLSYFLDSFGGAKVPSAGTLYPSFTDGTKGYMYIQVDGAGDNTLSDGLFADNRQRQINLVDTASFTAGAHTVKFGFDYRRLSPISDSGSYRRQFNPNNIGLLTQGLSANAFILSPEFVLKPVYTNLSSFVQDTWRVSRRLTLTAGLRWDINPAPTEAGGHYPPSVQGLANPATVSLAPANNRFYATDYKGWAPRLGVAYQAFGNTMIRGGAGVFYDLGTSLLGNAFSTSLYPNARRIDFTRIDYTDPAFQAQPPAVNRNPPYPRLFGYQDQYRLPYTLQYNLLIEQPIGRSNSISGAYVGSSGRRLGRVTSYRNPNALFTRIDAVTNDASSNYNALQLQFKRRFAAGLQVLASYTWSKSLDTVSEESINNFQAPGANARADYGPSTFDVRHAFSSAVSYNLPSPARAGRVFGGFGLDGIVRSMSATPVNILTNRDPFGIGLTTVARPNVVPGQPLYLEDPALAGGRRFNPAAFTVPTAGQGNLGRNVLRGFPLTQLDLSVRRDFGVTERVTLQFRADAFNVLNHANFANPSGVLTSGVFGRATQMAGSGLSGLSSLYQVGGPRSLQLALKLRF